jgi:hypothetical protein
VSGAPFQRGDGVGLEFTRHVVRGVRLSSTLDGRLDAAGEVAVSDADDDRSVLDALVRLRADLGEPREPTRIATFPPASLLHRIEVTGRDAAELNSIRVGLMRDHSIASTVLLDDGPRRWILAVRWDESFVRRLEELAERAGFAETTVEPSPIAVARVLHSSVTRARRDSASDESFESLIAHGQTVAAGAVDSVGRPTPSLLIGTQEVSATWFDGIDDAVELMVEIRRIVGELDGTNVAENDGTDEVHRLWMGDEAYPTFPLHDLRSSARQCVALGAAVGAAGLVGRLRPVDMLLPGQSGTGDRPWVIERLSDLPPRSDVATIGPVRRLASRLLPRRSR